jgi:UrcA family protein
MRGNAAPVGRASSGWVGPKANAARRTEPRAAAFCNGRFDEAGQMELRMATRRSGAYRFVLIMAACGAAMTSAQAAPAASQDEQVTVQDTPYTVRQEEVGRTVSNMSQMKVRQTSVSRGVTYSDLDLSKDSDVAVLKDRAKNAAWDVCRQAERRPASPLDRHIGVEPDCVTNARRQAVADVNRIVADARAGRMVAAK